MVDFDPTADPDGDGWTNEQEAVTGTNPLDANAPVGFIRPHIEYIPAVYITPEVEGGEPEILSPEITTITWPTLAGKLYTLFASTDLSPGSWTTIGTPNFGRGTEIAIAISLSQSDGGIPERLFLRVSVLDIDQDSDTLTNAEEAELGSLPYSADGDNDGLNDLEELFTYQTHPVSRDSDGDGVSDPDEILVNFTNPLTAADADGDGIPDDFEKYFAKQLLVYQADSSAWGTHYAGLVAGNLNATYDYTGDGMSVRELAEILKKIAAAGPAASGYHLEQQGRRNSIPWAYYFSSSSSSSSEGIYSHSVPNDYDVRISITPTADLSSQYLLSRIDGVPWSGSYITPGDQMNFFNGTVESAFRSTPVMSPNDTKFQGRISQQRSRLVATHPGHEAYSKTYLKVVENSHYFSYDHSGVITVEPLTIQVPKGKMLSDWCEFKAPVVSESDGRSAELRLLQMEFRGYVTGERAGGSAEAGEKYRHLISDPDDYTGFKTEPKTELKIVQWGDNDIFDANNNGAFDHAKFKEDVDIFRIRLPDIDPPAGTAEHRIKIWTVDAAGTTLDQGAEVDLNVFNNFHETAALGLVADDETDDTFAVEGKADGALGDRTYRAKLGGKLKFQWLTCPCTGEKPIFEIPIRVKKIVTAKGFLLKGTTDATTATYWFDRAKKIYSAIGVDLQYTLKTIDPLPTGVDLSDKFDIPEETAGYLHKMMPETIALMDDPGCQVDPGTIPVFFVNELEPAAQGVTNVHSYMASGDEKYGGAIFIDSTHEQESVLAHELAHVLLDAQHEPSSNALWNDYFLNYDRHRTNIWFGNQNAINHWSETGISAHRRLADTMRSRIWKSPYAKAP